MKTVLAFVLVGFAFFQNPSDEKKARRVQFLDQVFTTLENNIADVRWLEEESFLDFKERMYSDSVMSLSGSNFYHTFNEGRRKLPFSHFEIVPKSTSENSSEKSEASETKNPAVWWEAVNEKTAYLKIRTFEIAADPVIKAVLEIGVDRYENLIIDLRNNGGGAIDGPVVLGQFLTQETIDGGYYLTRKWFESNEKLPTANQVNEMPFLQDFTFAGITKMYDEEAAFRTVIPGHNRPVFQGKVYVLIDHWTASACEPLIDLLKKKNLATLVGETSYGGMLSGRFFDINENWKVFVPIADYYTADGTKIDRVGVTPHIAVDPQQAKTHVLELIAQEKRSQ